MVMKLEVGRTYVDKDRNQVRCIGLIPENENWPYVCTLVNKFVLMRPFLVDINGDNDASFNITGTRVSRLMKEYKEPVIHKKDVVWFKMSYEDHVLVRIVGIGDKIFSSSVGPHVVELKRETVTYTDEG